MSQAPAALLRLRSGQRRLPQGAFLFHRGDPVRSLFLVREGEVELLRRQENGASLLLQRAGPHDVLAEASVLSGIYHCDAVAACDSRLTAIPTEEVRRALATEPEFALAWTGYHSQRVQQARFRCELLALRTVAGRLDMWLDWHGEVPPRGQWMSLAREIGVTPEALYRELARRRVLSSWR